MSELVSPFDLIGRVIGYAYIIIIVLYDRVVELLLDLSCLVRYFSTRHKQDDTPCAIERFFPVLLERGKI